MGFVWDFASIIYNNIWLIVLLIATPLLHSLEQVLTKKPLNVRWLWLDWKTFYKTLDGEHVTRWLMVGAYGLLAITVDFHAFRWYIYPVYVFLFHWTAYNIGYHRLWIREPERSYLKCFSPVEFFYLLFRPRAIKA